MRRERSFEDRPETEREWLLANAPCPHCVRQTGITEPSEFEEDGVVFLEGRCRDCGREVLNELIDKIG